MASTAKKSKQRTPKKGDWIESPNGKIRKKVVDIPGRDTIALNDGWGPYPLSWSGLAETGWRIIPQDASRNTKKK